jgi:hypothetical protein
VISRRDSFGGLAGPRTPETEYLPKEQRDYGKDNRILHTEQLPENAEVGLFRPAREGNRVRFEKRKIGVR